MVQQSSQEQAASEDPHQHPGFLEVQRKMRRLILWSGMIMVLGIAAIIGVIVYKSMGKKERPSVASVAQPLAATQVLGGGEVILSMSADSGYVYLLVEGKGVKSLLQLDGQDMRLLRRMQFIPQGE